MRSWPAFVIGLIAGGLVTGVLYSYPKDEVTQATYCRACGTVKRDGHTSEVLGRRGEHSEKPSAFTRLIERRDPQHKHRWAEPTAYVFPTFPEREQPASAMAVANRLQLLDEIGENPDLVSDLVQAYDNDPARAQLFIESMLDPEKPIPVTAVSLLLGGPRAWPEKWALVDSFSKAYQCDTDAVGLHCHMSIKGKDEPILEIGPHSSSTGALSDWVAQGS